VCGVYGVWCGVCGVCVCVCVSGSMHDVCLCGWFVWCGVCVCGR
jgi:hypothetical protein